MSKSVNWKKIIVLKKNDTVCLCSLCSNQHASIRSTSVGECRLYIHLLMVILHCSINNTLQLLTLSRSLVLQRFSLFRCPLLVLGLVFVWC